MKPLITVIIPVYNTEKELPRCINSIITQSYKKLETLLIDNASSDNSGEICDKYSLIDPRIKVMHLDKSGLSYARNEGLKVSSGEYISFIDSDDWIEKDFYEMLISEIQDCSIAIVGYKLLDESGMIVNTIELIKDNFVLNQENLINVECMVKNSVWGFAWNKLYKREIVEKVRFPELQLREDMIFNLSLLKPNLRIKVIGQYTGYNWVQRANSITHKVDSRNINIPRELSNSLLNINWKFNKQSKIVFYNYIMKVLLMDIIMKDIVNNINLNKAEKKELMCKLLGRYKNLHIFKDDSKYIKIMVICFKIKQWRLLLKISEMIKGR